MSETKTATPEPAKKQYAAVLAGIEEGLYKVQTAAGVEYLTAKECLEKHDWPERVEAKLKAVIKHSEFDAACGYFERDSRTEKVVAEVSAKARREALDKERGVKVRP